MTEDPTAMEQADEQSPPDNRGLCLSCGGLDGHMHPWAGGLLCHGCWQDIQWGQDQEQIR